ncbi:MAG TPA: HlyD family efflux transporter periplasmic adaptor subunit, partial [Gemmataceae bacterium]|nr:HlyD family efflux transporter periplasmic adaptor subunit [Gemmataceae bacterium]
MMCVRRCSSLWLPCLFFCPLWLGCAGAKPPAEENPPPAPVTWEPALPLVLQEWTEVVGTTTPLPDRVARISAPVEGRVVDVLKGKNGKAVIEGQLVEPGTILVQLDPTLMDANVARTAAALSVLKQDEEQAKIAEKLAKVDVDRLRGVKNGAGLTGVSPIEIKKAEIALEDASSKVLGAHFKWEAGLKDLLALQAQRQLFSIATPIRGRLGRLLVVPAQTVSVGAPVAEVVDVEDQIDVLCFVSSHVARDLALGQSAFVGALGDDPAHASTVEGSIVFIGPQGETDTGNIAVKVRFPNKELGLRTNTTLRVRVLTKPGKACHSLPESAFMEDQDPPTVIAVENIETKPVEGNGKPEEIGK